MTRTISNSYNGRTRSIETRLDDKDALAKFAETAGQDHWLWFHIHNHVNRELEKNPVVADNTRFIGDLFLLALGAGLKNPMIRIAMDKRRFKIMVNKKGTICVYSGHVEPGTKKPVGDEAYMGCLIGGRWLVANKRDPSGYGFLRDTPVELDETQNEFIQHLHQPNVQDFFAKQSKDMDRCCYCYSPLSTVSAKFHGYGDTCAKKWGNLPFYTEKQIASGHFEKTPSFAEVYAADEYRGTLQGFMMDIRSNPYEESTWLILRDYLLQHHDMTVELSPPSQTVKVPRQ